MPTKLGRPLKKDGPKLHRQQYKTLVLQVEVHDQLSAIRDRLSEQLGFVPTATQVVAYLIKQSGGSRE